MPLRIGELAEASGVSVRSLRYYEQRELITSRRTPGGQRRFDADTVDRVILIQEFLAAGLTSAVILRLLPCVYSGTTTSMMIDELSEQREDIDRRARELTATRERLDELIVEARSRLRTVSQAGDTLPG